MGRSVNMRDGMIVVGVDGDEIGQISGMDDQFILVKGGGAFGTEYQVPRSAISRDDGETVRLTVTKEEALDQRWPGTLAGDE